MSGAYCGWSSKNYFSSPNIIVKGDDGTMVTLGTADESDVARTLNEVADEVVNFMPTTN